MNLLAIDYGSKNIGLAVSIQDIIFPINPISNDSKKFDQIKEIVNQYQVHKIFVGVSDGDFAKVTLKFVDELKNMLTCEVETVEEAVSTIEADQIFSENNKKKKNYKKLIDSISAAVILRRVNTY